MNEKTDGAAAPKTASLEKVQTSAPTAPSVVHQEPAVGGSYIRNPETGDLAKQEPVKKQPEQE